MKIEKLLPGIIVYDVHKHKMGNTTISTVGVWPVHIIDVDTETMTVTASWSGNKSQKYHESTWSKWRLKEPVLIRSRMGYCRIATRAEIKAMEDKQRRPQNERD